LPQPTLNVQSISGSQTATLSIKCAGATPGTYTVNVQGTSGSLTHTVPVTVTVTQGQQSGSFTISASPASIKVLQGCENMSTITLTSNGFVGDLTLSAVISPGNSGVSTILSSSQVHLALGQSQHVILTVSASQSATTGSYTVTVTARSGSMTQSTIVHVNVVTNSCHVQEHENCSSEDDDQQIDHSDQNGTPCKDSDNNGAIHGIGNCANEDRDDHHRASCGCPSLTSEHEKKHHHEKGSGDHDDDTSCHTSCNHHDDNESREGSEHKNSHSTGVCKGTFDKDNDDTSTDDPIIIGDKD
jgi:hypothetical protein